MKFLKCKPLRYLRPQYFKKSHPVPVIGHFCIKFPSPALCVRVLDDGMVYRRSAGYFLTIRLTGDFFIIRNQT